MQNNKSSQDSIKVSSAQYEELAELELETISGGKYSRSRNSGSSDAPSNRNRTTTVMGIRG